MKIAIAVSRFNDHITQKLLSEAIKELGTHGVSKKNIDVIWVPGAYELPFAAQKLAQKKVFDAIICLGCIIKGETTHDQHIATWCSVGIGEVSLAYNIPVLFGVLTPNSEAQAIKRATPGPLNRGREVAKAAIEMVSLGRTRGR
jgi:6,7-dimethyl-8-ribityllumazine synthase